MIINFQFTLDDYRNAFRAHYRKGASAFTRWVLKLVLVVGVLFLLLSVLFVITGQRALNVVLPPFLLGAFWIWVGMGKTYLLSARSQFAKSPALREPRRIEFNDEGVKTDAGIASSQVSWKAFLRYVESTDTFLLYTSPACFVVFPKRVLQGEQVNELRGLFQTHIGKDVAVAVA
ncbi:MAG: YcxB family protein [Candidatus Angelobacter sp.]